MQPILSIEFMGHLWHAKIDCAPWIQKYGPQIHFHATE